ncbi:MAG TPA: hypothetical protein VLL54_13170 [Pyrinomonadaceae bacterium]|nr:hypothetical protein [Pyrinomonadaceae bacterium]
MKILFRSARALTPWLALAVPILFFTLMSALESLFPYLFCMPINPGGKEFICGARYSDAGINLLRALGFSAWVLLLVTGGVNVFRWRVARLGVMAWAVSGLLFIGLVLLWLSLPAHECPG